MKNLSELCSNDTMRQQFILSKYSFHFFTPLKSLDYLKEATGNSHSFKLFTLSLTTVVERSLGRHETSLGIEGSFFFQPNDMNFLIDWTVESFVDIATLMLSEFPLFTYKFERYFLLQKQNFWNRKFKISFKSLGINYQKITPMDSLHSLSSS